MKVIADAKDYSADRSFSGFACLAVAAVPLTIIPIYLIFSPEQLFPGAPAAGAAALACSLATLAFLAIYLKGNGLLFKVPLKACSDGLLIQSSRRMTPEWLDYSKISSIELWFSSHGAPRSGCAVSAADGDGVRSVENFRDKASFKEFSARLSSLLEQNGFRAGPVQEGESSARCLFRKPLDISGIGNTGKWPSL